MEMRPKTFSAVESDDACESVGSNETQSGGDTDSGIAAVDVSTIVETDGDNESLNRSMSPDDDIEIVNFQDYVSLNVNRYDFSQVIFVEVKEYYEPGEKVICRYKVTGGLYPHAKDKVCLFRLGWISAQDYKATVYAPMLPKYQAGMMFDSAVSFEGSNVVEQDSDDYYQFCYINHQDQIRGASTPFQFKAGYSSNENDESCSPSTSTVDFSTIQELKDRIDRLSQEKDLLVQKNAEKENEIFECSMKIEELEHKLIMHVETVENENQQRIQIDELTTSLNELQYAFSKEKDVNRHKVEELESDLDKLKTTNCEQMESYSILLKQITKLQKEKTDAQIDLEALVSEKESLQKLHCDLENENEKLLKQIISLQEEQESLNDMLSHRNEDIDGLVAKLSNAETSVALLKRDLEEQKSEMDNLKMAHEANMAQMQQIPDQLAGPVYALKKALDHTQQKLESANKFVEKCKNENEMNKAHLVISKERLEQEKNVSHDLLVRLDMAKLTYKVKYVEANKYKKELKNAMMNNKQGYKKVCEDIEQELKVYETQQKLSDSSICVQPPVDCARGFESHASNIFIEQSSTCANEISGIAGNSLMQQLEAEIGAEDDENDSVYMDMENCNEAGTENVAASSSGVKQSTVASPSIDVIWKRFDMCLVNCSDGFDRLACVVDVEKDISMLSLRVVYQQEVNCTSQPSDIYQSGSMQVMTQLFPEKYPVQKVRPYNGEQVPRDVWMTLGGYIFAHPNERIAIDTAPNEASTAHEGLSKAASLDMALMPCVKQPQAAAAEVGEQKSQKSIGGVGWGSFSAHKFPQPIKSLFSNETSSAAAAAAPINVSETATGAVSLISLKGHEQYASALAERETIEVNKCLLCEKLFPKDVNPEIFNAHMEEHYGPSCPFCMLRFSKTPEGEQKLMHHVNGHLQEMGDL